MSGSAFNESDNALKGQDSSSAPYSGNDFGEKTFGQPSRAPAKQMQSDFTQPVAPKSPGSAASPFTNKVMMSKKQGFVPPKITSSAATSLTQKKKSKLNELLSNSEPVSSSDGSIASPLDPGSPYGDKERNALSSLAKGSTFDSGGFGQGGSKSMQKGGFGQGASKSMPKGSFGQGAPKTMQKGGFGQGAPKSMQKGDFGQDAPKRMKKGGFEQDASKTMQKSGFGQGAPDAMKEGSFRRDSSKSMQKGGSGQDAPVTMQKGGFGQVSEVPRNSIDQQTSTSFGRTKVKGTQRQQQQAQTYSPRKDHVQGSFVNEPAGFDSEFDDVGTDYDSRYVDEYNSANEGSYVREPQRSSRYRPERPPRRARPARPRGNIYQDKESWDISERRGRSIRDPIRDHPSSALGNLASPSTAQRKREIESYVQNQRRKTRSSQLNTGTDVGQFGAVRRGHQGGPAQRPPRQGRQRERVDYEYEGWEYDDIEEVSIDFVALVDSLNRLRHILTNLLILQGHL